MVAPFCFSLRTLRPMRRSPARETGIERSFVFLQFDNTSDYIYIVILMLGEFEYLLLSAAVRLGDDAYGASIRREVEDATGRRCSIGALYTTLDRLQKKGLVKTWMGPSTPERGGRAKRMVAVTPNGVRAACDFYSAVKRASRDLSWSAERAQG